MDRAILLEAKDRIISRIKRSLRNECWPWIGQLNEHGYGVISLRRRPRLAHRAVWELEIGPIPEGLCVLHRCDNPPCCNPEHLWLGTRGDNNRDTIHKGRARRSRGESNPQSKLTDAQVVLIRQKYIPRRWGHGFRALASEFGVGKTTIEGIICRRHWKHI